MDMHGGIAAQALGRVLDDEVRALNAVIGRDVGSRSSRCGTAPGEPCLGDIGLKLCHTGRGRAFVNNVCPLGYQVEQHGALPLVHRGSLQTLGLYRLAVLSRSEHKIGQFVAKNRLFALRIVKGIEQCQSLVALLAERTHGFSVKGVESRLGAGQSRREDTVFAGDGDVERQMVPSKLQHPWVLLGGLPQNGDVVKVFAEDRVAAFLGFEDLVTFHDLLYLLKAPSAEPGRNQSHSGRTLSSVQFLEAEATTRNERSWQVGPVCLLLFVVKRK